MEYKCGICGAIGVKLWRKYQTTLDNQTLACLSCSENEQGKKMKPGSDQIGWRIPAVPTDDGDSFWGYTSVPQEGVDWWKALPDAPVDEEYMRKQIALAEINPDILFCDGLEPALIGAVQIFNKHVALYDYHACIDHLIERDGSTYEEAVEHLDFNTLGAYVGENTPGFLIQPEEFWFSSPHFLKRIIDEHKDSIGELERQLQEARQWGIEQSNLRSEQGNSEPEIPPWKK